MANGKKYPAALFWIDLETSQLPVGNDYSDVQILEVGIIVTDFDLKPYFGYQGVVQMNETIKASLRNNPEVVDMHVKNGLLKDSKESTDTLEVIEAEIIAMLKNKTAFEKGEFMIAGSGVAAFDFPVIKEHMPELASWFTYASFDIGAVRRAAYYLSGRRDIVTNVKESSSDKSHRAMDDIKAHIKEANLYRILFNQILDSQTTEKD